MKNLTPKKTKQEMQKVVLYSFLYLETLDKLKPINPKVIKFKEDIIGFLEAIGEDIKDTEAIQKGSYFADVSNKIDTVVRRCFEEN